MTILLALIEEVATSLPSRVLLRFLDTLTAAGLLAGINSQPAVIGNALPLGWDPFQDHETSMHASATTTSSGPSPRIQRLDVSHTKGPVR